AGHHAEISLAGAGSIYVRSTSFVRTVLCSAHLLSGNLDQALHEARAVLDVAAQLKSYRVISYLEEFRTQLAPHAANNLVRDFIEQAARIIPSEHTPVATRLIVA